MAPTGKELDTPVSSFRFFDLPAELRIKILSYLLISDGVLLFKRDRFDPRPYERVKIIYIFLVNVQMYQEASAIFYEQNRFILDGHGHRLPGDLTKPDGFLSPQGHDARQRVRTLDLYLTRVGGEFETKLAPIISRMILSGRLRQLKIHLSPPSSPRARISGPDVNMMARTPFQALFSLLSDPDLEHVEMCVWNVHWVVFCPFHGESDLTTKGDALREVVDNHGLARARGSPGWIRLDWKAMVHKFGTNKRIMKITEPDL
jgi:hypothetical protein